MPEQFGRHLDWDLDANGCSLVPSCGVTWDRTKYFLDPLVTNGAGQYWIADRAERRKELLDEFLVWTAVNDTVTEEEMLPVIDESKLPQDILDIVNWVPDDSGMNMPVTWDRKKYSLSINKNGIMELIPREQLIRMLLDDSA
ncbi:hypothetical protein quinque_015463 [Culex quinquefasciatus]